jgi:hypothetical protein
MVSKTRKEKSYQRKYRDSYRDVMSEQKKNWEAENKEHRRVQIRAWRDAHSTEANAAWTKWKKLQVQSAELKKKKAFLLSALYSRLAPCMATTDFCNRILAYRTCDEVYSGMIRNFSKSVRGMNERTILETASTICE